MCRSRNLYPKCFCWFVGMVANLVRFGLVWPVGSYVGWHYWFGRLIRKFVGLFDSGRLVWVVCFVGLVRKLVGSLFRFVIRSQVGLSLRS